MDNKTYYTEDLANSNRSVTDKPLFVNCTGVCSFQMDFSGGHEKGREDYYLMYLCRGELIISISGQRLTLTSGQFILFPPKTPCTYQNRPGTQVEYLWLHFTGFQAKMLVEKTHLPLCCPAEVSVDERIISAFQLLFDEYIDRDFLFHTAVVSKLVSICILFGRAVAALSAKKRGTAVLSNSLRYIDEHYAEPITTQELANLEHLSCGHFRVLFKAKTGMTPAGYITTLRLRNACVLLKQTDLTIKEISQSVGFSDQMYFTRVFSKQFGMPPKVFRK